MMHDLTMAGLVFVASATMAWGVIVLPSAWLRDFGRDGGSPAKRP